MRKTFLSALILLLMPFTAFSASLDDARKDYLNGDYDEAIVKAKSVPTSGESLYFLGLVYMKMGNFPQGREYFLRVMQNFPRSAILEETSFKLADSYFLEGDFSKAKALYKEIEKKYPSSDYKPILYLRLAQTAGKEGQWDEKKKYLSLLKEKYPSSGEFSSDDVSETKEDFFTIQIGAFSNRKNALSLKNELSEKYSAYVIEENRDSYTLYKVRVGKFKDRKEAEKIWGKLAKQGYPAKIYP